MGCHNLKYEGHLFLWRLKVIASVWLLLERILTHTVSCYALMSFEVRIVLFNYRNGNCLESWNCILVAKCKAHLFIWYKNEIMWQRRVTSSLNYWSLRCFFLAINTCSNFVEAQAFMSILNFPSCLLVIMTNRSIRTYKSIAEKSEGLTKNPVKLLYF